MAVAMKRTLFFATLLTGLAAALLTLSGCRSLFVGEIVDNYAIVQPRYVIVPALLLVERELVGGLRGHRLDPERGQHGFQPVPGHLVLSPVPQGQLPGGGAQLRAGHAVAIDGGVLRGERGLQRRGYLPCAG